MEQRPVFELIQGPTFTEFRRLLQGWDARAMDRVVMTEGAALALLRDVFFPGARIERDGDMVVISAPPAYTRAPRG